MKPRSHNLNVSPYLCELTGMRTNQVFTDHSRIEKYGLYNACEHCHSDKRTVARRLSDLNHKREVEDTDRHRR